jgi:hypothetical protein
VGKPVTRSTRCGNGECGENFTYSYDLARVPAGMTSYRLSCPFCGTVQTVSLQAGRTVEILKSGEQREITELSVPENPVGVVEETPPHPSPYHGRE